MLIRHRPKWHSDHPDLVIVVDIDEDWFGPLHLDSRWPMTAFDFSPPGMLSGVSDDYFEWLPEQ